MPTNEEIEAMKFEALATLIATNHEETKHNLDSTKEMMDLRFKGLETHNEKQNGSICRAINKITQLEKESQERKLTCGKAVKVLEENARKAKEEKKVHKSQKLSRRQWVALFIVSAFMMTIMLGGFIISIINMKT